MATYTLFDLRAAEITIGALTLSDFGNDSSTVSSRLILIDTVEGPNPGINIRVDPSVAATADLTQTVGIDFEVNSSQPILAGATLSLDGYGFSVSDGGGRVAARLTQQRIDPNLLIDVVVDNEPGAADFPIGTDEINGGPVPRFKFEYDMTLDPNNGVTGVIGQTAIRFDLAEQSISLPDNFDGLQYIASHADLAAALGDSRAAGEQHYISFGQREGRAVDTFSETEYLRKHVDLSVAFGTDVNAATAHYITNGLREGRNDGAPSPAQVQGLQYIASHADLIAALGANAMAGQQHYASFGRTEGRALDTFNETVYLAKYADLQAAFGTNTDAATDHYIQFGFAEGRDDFLL